MNKHRLMLSAAVTALIATPALAAGPTTITKIQTTAITTATDGDTTINSGGGVQITAASAAVTVNSSNLLNNGGLISNTNTTNAVGLLIDATNGPFTSTSGVTNSGTIDLTGTGTGKFGFEVTGGTYTGPITLVSGTSVIKVAGDNSVGLLVNSTGIVNGDMALDGTISMSPTTASNLSTGTASTIAEIAGTVNGNVTVGPTASYTGTGEGTQGLVVGPTGSICNAAGCAAGTPSTTDIGTLTNEGNITVEGIVVTTNSSGSISKATRPESGSALVVSGNVQGGIVNAGPSSTSDTTGEATLSASGIVPTSGAALPTVVIGPTTTTINPIAIGKDTLDVTNPGFSFINRGSINAAPLNANNSTVAFEVAGQSGFETTLQGGIFNSGTISASATSATATNAANPSATALYIAPFATVPNLVVSGQSVTSSTSSLGTIVASVSGELGGVATAVRIDASSPQTGSGLAEIDVKQGAKIVAGASTSEPTTTTALSAFAIVDNSGTLSLINNAGTISATVTTLTPPVGTTTTITNIARAIDLSAATGPVTVNTSGTIVGDILLNSSNSSATPTVFNVGVGSYSCSVAGSCNTQNSAAFAIIAANPTAAFTANTLNAQATISGVNNELAFGTGLSTLNINDFGNVTAQVTSIGTTDVNVAQQGTLDLTNVTSNLVVRNLLVSGGHLDLAVSDPLRQAAKATLLATGSATLQTGTTLGLTIATFVPQPATGTTTNQYPLISAPTGQLHISAADLATYQAQIINANALPFFFDPTKSSLNEISTGELDELVVNLAPRPATGPGGLGLTGDAVTLFPYANAALQNDNQLGAAVVNGITNATKAEAAYSQFSPDVSGDVRAEAVALTDQATGPVAARQRLLRNYADQGGDFTLWGQEFAQYVNNKGNTTAGGTPTNYKSHGFGFVLGADGGDPDDGWYGGAFTFFGGDATKSLPNDAKNQTEWLMLTGYTDWRGPHLFLDTQASIAYGDLKGKRFIDISVPQAGSTTATTTFTREADGKRAGLLGAIGATTGAIFNWGSTVFMPQISLDGMSMREEGYTETGGGDGFNLAVQPYYATSLRAFLGADVREDLDLGVFVLQPEARVGYRYDFLNDPIKVKAAFVSVPDSTFSITGPDPTHGNVVAGATLGASTDTWSMGLNFDWVRGSNGNTTEVGTFSILGRI